MFSLTLPGRLYCAFPTSLKTVGRFFLYESVLFCCFIKCPDSRPSRRKFKPSSHFLLQFPRPCLVPAIVMHASVVWAIIFSAQLKHFSNKGKKSNRYERTGKYAQCSYLCHQRAFKLKLYIVRRYSTTNNWILGTIPMKQLSLHEIIKLKSVI